MMASDNEQSDDPYCIVDFINEADSRGNKVIDVVPSSWTVKNNDGLITQCFYPPSDEIESMEALVKDQAAAKPFWEKYDVDVIATAADLKQAHRRCKRALKRRTDLESADSDSARKNPPPRISKETASEIMGNSIPLSSIFEEGVNQDDESDQRQSTDDRENDDNSTKSPVNVPHSIEGNGRMTKAGKKETLKLRLLELKEKFEDRPEKVIMDYVDLHTELLALRWKDDLATLRRAIQIDLNKVLEKIQTSTLLRSAATAIPEQSPREELDLPQKTLEQFLEFDASLEHENKAAPEEALRKQDTLKKIMHLLTSSSRVYEADIKLILKSVITKAVQINYSGRGRVVKGKSKLNFSATRTFKCMSSFIENKYKDSPIPLKIGTVTSDWLAGAADREGGAVQRKKAAQKE